MGAAEILGKNGRCCDFQSFGRFHFSKYGICDGRCTPKDKLVRKFDVVLANQVWEHLDSSHAATRNVLRILRMGGYFWLAVPFVVRCHGSPHDCSRWKVRGLTHFLVEADFDPDHIRAGQWGNRHAAPCNLEAEQPPSYAPKTDDLTNDQDNPIWAWLWRRKFHAPRLLRSVFVRQFGLEGRRSYTIY
jgi:SAM-dependent methyltransferase